MNDGLATVLAARIPGWAPASRSPLATGSNNATYLLERNGEQAVLKVALRPRRFPLLSRPDEARLQSVAHARGLAPRVLYADETLLLEEFVPGRDLAPAELGEPRTLARVAAGLRRLHASPLSGRRFPLLAAATAYRDAVRGGEDDAEAGRQLAVIEAVEPFAGAVFSHNDLVAGNLRATDGLCLLDWEYSGDNDPLFDLATVVAAHRVEREAALGFLRAYYGPGGERRWPALARMCRVYDALAWLWAAERKACGD